MNIVYVAIRGSAGSLARYYGGVWITNATSARTPGTVAVNVLGIHHRTLPGAERRAVVVERAAAACGRRTPGRVYDVLDVHVADVRTDLVGRGAPALLNVGCSLAAGMLAVWAGASLAKAF